MSRLKRLRNIDSFINVIEAIISTNQCSLSVQDLKTLKSAIDKLQILKRKKGLTNKQLQSEVAEIVELITKFLINQNL